MPKQIINYHKSLIYEIICKDVNAPERYIGSTTSFVKRKASHKSACHNEQSKKYNYNVYNYIRHNGNWGNWTMILIEHFPCDNKLELEKRERHWIEIKQATLNKVIPTRTKKEYAKYYQSANTETMKQYQIDNKDKKRDYDKEYRKNNIDKRKDYNREYQIKNINKMRDYIKEYNIKNKDKITEIHDCECGGTYRQYNKSRHIKTKKHILHLHQV